MQFNNELKVYRHINGKLWTDLYKNYLIKKYQKPFITRDTGESNTMYFIGLSLFVLLRVTVCHIFWNLRDSSHFNTRRESDVAVVTTASGRDRFCPGRIFFADSGEPLGRARLIARPPTEGSKDRRPGEQKGWADSAHVMLVTRRTILTSVEESGTFRAVENVNRKRTHRLRNRDDRSQRRRDVDSRLSRDDTTVYSVSRVRTISRRNCHGPPLVSADERIKVASVSIIVSICVDRVRNDRDLDQANDVFCIGQWLDRAMTYFTSQLTSWS